MVPKKSQFSPKVPNFAFVELFRGRSQIPNPVLQRLHVFQEQDVSTIICHDSTCRLIYPPPFRPRVLTETIMKAMDTCLVCWENLIPIKIQRSRLSSLALVLSSKHGGTGKVSPRAKPLSTPEKGVKAVILHILNTCVVFQHTYFHHGIVTSAGVAALNLYKIFQ